MAQYLRAVAVVALVAVAAYALYGAGLDVPRGADGLHWRPVVEGALAGAAATAVWFASTRRAAALGLGAAVVLVIGGAAGYGAAVPFVRAPMGWAAVAALLARLVVAVPPRSAVPHPEAAVPGELPPEPR